MPATSGCHVGSAFASLGDSRDPDILAVAGDMSSGRIQSIGNWFTPIRVSVLSRYDAMQMTLTETIPNWASVTDMVVSALPGKSQRSRGGVFVTSCRQPYGAITELRRGLEARLSVYCEIEGLRSVTEVWGAATHWSWTYSSDTVKSLRNTLPKCSCRW